MSTSHAPSDVAGDTGAADGCPVRHYPFGEPVALELDAGYEQVRQGEGLTRVQLPYGTPTWLVTRYDDVKAMLSDTRLSRAEACGEDEPRVMSYVHRSDSITTMDPPRHSRLRRVVSRAFTPRRIDELRPAAERSLSELLQTLPSDEPTDFMQAVAHPLPMLVLCDLLGVPFDDRELFRQWGTVLSSTASSGVSAEQVAAANDALRAYLTDLVLRRRGRPEDDLLSVLGAALDSDDALAQDEAVSLAWSVLLAGYDITASEIGNFVYTLLTNESLFAELRAEPGRIGHAVEELLRQIPLTSAAFYPRRATEDLELGGTTVRAGEAVLASMTAANRDPAVFPEPGRVNLDRRAASHLAFSHGVHHCLGAQLARMELTCVLRGIVAERPALRLAVPAASVAWCSGTMLRAPVALPVIG